MTIRVRAKDGTVQTFPDGTSSDAVRLAMSAYDDPESWGGLGRKVAIAAGRKEAASSEAEGRRRNPVADVLMKAWALPNTALGLAAAGLSYGAGKLAGTDPKFRIGDNAIQLLNSPFNVQGRAYTLGNVQVYPRGEDPEARMRGSYSGRTYGRVGDHEEGHTRQAEILGPLYLPAELVGSLLFGDRNPLEVGADRFVEGRSWNGF